MRSSVSKNITAGQKSVKEILAKEATKTLENKRNIQTTATKEKTLDEIKKEMGIPLDSTPSEDTSPAAPALTDNAGGRSQPTGRTRRRVRQKMRSTPVVGGSLFDEPQPPAADEPQAGTGGDTLPGGVAEPRRFSMGGGPGGQTAELVVGGEVFKIRVMPETVHRIRSGYSGELLDDASVRFSQEDVPIEHRLQGFIRTSGMQTITEEESDTASEVGSEW